MWMKTDEDDVVEVERIDLFVKRQLALSRDSFYISPDYAS